MKTVEALKRMYVAKGGNINSVANISTIPAMIDAITGYDSIKDTTVQAEKGSATLFGAKVSTYQTDVVVSDDAITGALKFVEGGLALSGPLAGDGHFLALKFINNSDASDIKVGLKPSASNMPLQSLDSDMNAVFKITDNAQQLHVVTYKNNLEKVQVYDLTGLDLQEQEVN